MMADLKFALRQLAKAPGFTAVALLTLALGIGLNVSMFSLIDLVLLQPVPFADRSHLVRIFRTTPQSQSADHNAADYLEVARASEGVARVAGYRFWGVTLDKSGRPPENLNALRVSASFFPTLGMQPEMGRLFTADEDSPGHHVIIISHATWQAQFGGDPSVIGRTVRIDGEPTTIIGVMPAAFSSVFLWGPGDAFLPLALTPAERLDFNDTYLRILARYDSGLSLAQFNARLASLAARLARIHPMLGKKDGLRAVTLQSTVANPSSRGLVWLLFGLSASIVLVACANLANLQLARAIPRGPEFAIRAALGAPRGRLLRPLLAESLLLAVGGGALSILVASWSNAWISSCLSANGVVTLRLVIDWKGLGFAAGISAVTGVAFGIVPAWMMSKVRVSDALKSGARGNTGGRAQHHFRHGLIVAQFAIALVLLASAGVFIRGLNRMLSRDAGWNRHSLLQAIINLPQAKYTSQAQTYAFYTRLKERLSALPGVENVSIGWTLPVFQFRTSRNFVVEGRPAPPAGREPVAYVNGVMPSFLPTLKIQLISGRNFNDSDSRTAHPVVIINQSMARALFPNESPIGHRIGGVDPAHRHWAEIVGVMPDLRFAVSLAAPATRFQVFLPLAQETWNYTTVAVRARSAAALAGPMRRAISELDPDLPVQQLGTVDQMIDRQTDFGMVETILAAFAVLGLFLSSLGLYGVIARLVAQRTHELGVRMALGAQSRDVVWLILISGFQLVLLGAVLGLIGGAGLGRLLSGLLPEVRLQDPMTVAAVTLLLLVVALIACWLPARRASRIDPLVALRSD